jgi:Apea-like HEPN
MDQNKLKQLISLFNELIQLISNQKPQDVILPKRDFATPISSFFGNDSNKITLIGRDIHSQLERFTELLWDADQEIRKTTSIKAVKKKVIELILQQEQDSNKVDADFFKAVLNEFLKHPNQETQVFRPVYGASLSLEQEYARSIQLGPFGLHTWNDYYSLITSKDSLFFDLNLKNLHDIRNIEKSYPSNFPLLEDLGNIVISVKVSARDIQRIEELADERFNQFENVISYMLGFESKSINFGVKNYFNLTGLESVKILPTGISYGNEFNDSLWPPLNFDSPFFLDGNICSNEINSIQIWENFGHRWIWELLKVDASNLSSWQKRVLTAVEWVGKGLRDKNISSSFVQLVFALETLFTFKERGVLISPSIGSQLAEFTAFIVSDDLEGRLKTIKQVNEIYTFRSAVTHGGSNSISVSIFLDAVQLLKTLITRIITNPELEQLQSIEQLKDWVNNKKYS